MGESTNLKNKLWDKMLSIINKIIITNLLKEIALYHEFVCIISLFHTSLCQYSSFWKAKRCKATLKGYEKKAARACVLLLSKKT